MTKLGCALVGLTVVAWVGAGCEDDLVDDGNEADVGDAGDGADAADPLEGLPVLEARYEPDGAGFYRMPWPHDDRVLADGSVDLNDFPRADTGVLRTFREAMEGTVFGFSVMPTVYVALAGDPGSNALPEPADTLSPESDVQLIALTDGHCGERTPVWVDFYPEGDIYRADNVLTVSPVLGFPLRQQVTYAMVIRRSFGVPSGFQTGASPAFRSALETGAAFAPLRDCIADAGFGLGDIGVATVFTVQDAIGETLTIRDFVMDPAHTESPEVREWALVEDRTRPDDYTTYAGWYDTPIFQRGTSPYNTGGAFVLEDGVPVIQRWEGVPVTVTIPEDAGPGPHPVLIFVDGTGATQFGHVRSHPIQLALDEGFVVASFLPQFHGPRATPGSDPVTHSFNYLNPESGRTVFRQQVIDTSYFVRVIREALPGLEGMPALDDAHIVYGGQSQGALIGALGAGVEPEIEAWVLNGTGSELTVTIIERKDPFDIAELVGQLFQIPGDIDIRYPIVQIVQLGADPVDPHSYAPRWTGGAGHEHGTHVLMTNGMEDHTTHFTSMSALTIAADMAPIAPTGWDVDPWGVWDRDEESLPIQANRTAEDGSPLTIASFLNPDTGHYTIYDRDDVAEMAAQFWRSAVDEDAPFLDLP